MMSEPLLCDGGTLQLQTSLLKRYNQIVVSALVLPHRKAAPIGRVRRVIVQKEQRHLPPLAVSRATLPPSRYRHPRQVSVRRLGRDDDLCNGARLCIWIDPGAWPDGGRARGGWCGGSET